VLIGGVRRAGRELQLTKIEFELLRLLMVNAPVVMTREILHERIWGSEEMHMSNTLEVFISQLRKKTELADLPRIIQTVRGVGYVIKDQ
jgi:two-component system response regulator MprA